MRAFGLIVMALVATSTSFAAASYRCVVTESDLGNAEVVTLVEDCKDGLTMSISGHGETLVSKAVKYDWQNSDEQVKLFKSSDRKTLVYIQKNHVGLTAEVHDVNYMVRTNYCQQTGW
ncbi:hypothetical protein ACLVWU_10885 [Bdellovibrio sp. HCB290]|uniref:hypothetical protein n=1 Tax=Bdellovibrio sp. HCB290 TaxID=3394356 RepID=UPI0039B36A6E